MRRILAGGCGIGAALAALLLALLAGAPAAPAASGETITVTSAADTLGAGSGCTLRDALVLADSLSNSALLGSAEPGGINAAGDCAGDTSGSGSPYTILLPAGRTFTLTAIDNYWFGPDGLPPISDDVTIDGNGDTITRSSTAPAFRFFYVSGGLSGPPAGNLTLNDLTLSDGLVQGGAGGEGGAGAGLGGAIFNQGQLALSQVTASGNVAKGGAIADASIGGGAGVGHAGNSDGGGAFGGPAPGEAGGAGGNGDASGGGGGGGGFLAAAPGLTATSAAGALGGGLGGFGGGGGDGGSGGTGGPKSGQAGGGFAAGGSGAINSQGAAAGGGGGGGVGAGGGDSGAKGGSGGFGGGGGWGYSDGGDGGFGAGPGGSGNPAAQGTPGFGGAATNPSYSFGGGGAGMGGALFTLFGTVTIEDSTLAGNTATGAPGLVSGLEGDGLGGAIFNVDGTVTVHYATIADNTASGGSPAGGGIYNLGYGNTITSGAATDAELYADNSIIADNTAGGTADDIDGVNVNGNHTNKSYMTLNWDWLGALENFTGSASGGGDLAGMGNPKIGTLAANDGSTLETISPDAGSPVLGQGTNCDAADELGRPRPSSGCDLGALEVTNATSTSVSCTPGTVDTGSPSSCTATVSDRDSTAAPAGTVSFSATPSGGTLGSSGKCTLPASSTPSAKCSVSFSAATAGTYTVRASYLSGNGMVASSGSGTVTAQTPPVTTTTTTASPPPTTTTTTTTSASTTTTVATAVVPANTAAPGLSGTVRAGQTLTCSTGSWTGTGDSYSYQWNRDGTPLVGATGASYTVQKVDEGNILTCTVTASDSAGTGRSVTSAGVTVPVPPVRKCPRATGSVHGTTLGLVHLGMTRQQASKAFTRSSSRGKRYEEFFCLTPVGVRVGYGSPKLGKHSYLNRVVWISTASAYYDVDGVRVGATVQAAGHKLRLGKVFKIGLNDWYLAPVRGATAVLKVRHDLVQEIGIGDVQLTKGRGAQRSFLSSFE